MANEFIDGVSTSQAAGLSSSTSIPKIITKDGVQEDPKNIFISDMNQLKDKAPKVWDSMLKSLVHSMLKKMQKSGERVKKQIRRMVRGEN